jgi:nitrogen fixation NifU-like protein
VDRQTAIEVLLEHYQSPHHRGPIADADVMMPGGNPGCGDVVTIFLKVDKSADKVEKISFVGEGCTISQAAASILTDMVQDTSLEEIEDMDYHVMMDTLGQEVAQSRPRCSTLALGTLKAAIKKYRRDRMREEAGLPPPDETVEPFQV